MGAILLLHSRLLVGSRSHFLLFLLLALCLSLSLAGSKLGAVVLAGWLLGWLLLLGLENSDSVRKSLVGASLAIGVSAAHDLDLDAKNTLAKKNVAGGAVDELLSGLTGVDHETVGELHRLSTGSAKLARDNDLATLGSALHDEAEHTIAGTANGEAIEELVAERLALGDGAETTILNLGSVKRNRVLRELEPLLDETSELTNAATLLAENLLGVGSADDDIGHGRRNADLNTAVTLLGQLALKKLVELGVEDAIGDELALLGDLVGSGSHLDRFCMV